MTTWYPQSFSSDALTQQRECRCKAYGLNCAVANNRCECQGLPSPMPPSDWTKWTVYGKTSYIDLPRELQI
jgi:hypothetical protein